jgi:hypothetical protein
MNKLVFYLVLALLTLSMKVFGQEDFENKVKTIARNIANISKKEKENLKEELRLLDEKLEKKEISSEQMEAEKKQIAAKYAALIADKVTVEEEKLKKVVKERAENSVVEIERDSTKSFSKTFEMVFKNKKIREVKSESRNTISFVFAMGINNALSKEQGIDNSPFKTWGSHFYELGFTNNYRILKENNLLKLRYGFSFVYNNLRPKDNQLFTVNGNQTNLETSPVDLKDSRFRIVQLNLPVYFEFDFSPNKLDKDGKRIFQSKESFKIGLGGYVGANISTRQYLEYRENGHRMELLERGDFNTHDIAYGVGAYIGYKSWSLYTKYDLNTVFKNNTQELNNISFGIRIE